MAALRCALLAPAISLAAGSHAHAQFVSATGVRNVAFGDVIPGLQNTVQPTDVIRSGQFNITGPSLAQVEITFALPATLSNGGATMPISFGATSAGYSSSGAIGSQTPFDPRSPFRTNLSPLGRGSTFIGGIVAPAGTQSAGSYSGSLGMTVALVGI